MMNFMETASAAVIDSFAAYASDTRLYEFTLRDSDDLAPWLDHGGLLVAAFVSQDSLHQVPYTDLLVLSRRTDLPLTRLITRIATLHISQADASRTHITGLISNAICLGSDGGLTRYQLRMTPWLDMLSQVTHSRVWQDQPVNAIIDSVFADYAPHAHWQWSGDTGTVLRQLPPRSYCVQYRETDLDFVSRLLSEDGFSWRIEHDAPNAPSGHSLVIFADSTQTDACPTNSDNGQSGLRYAGTGSQQQTDSITRLAVAHSLQPARLTLASYDYKAKAISNASTPSDIGLGGKYYSQLPPVEHYDYPGQYAFTDRTDADRQAVLRMQAHEIRQQRWQGQSTVRSLRAGQRFNIDGNPRPGTAAIPDALIATQIIQLGINNLPNAAGNHLARSFGPLTGWLRDTLCGSQQDGNAPTSPSDTAPAEPGKLVATAQRLGYANAFTVIPATRPWRAQVSQRLNDPSATDGSQTARIVGFDSNTDATAAQPGDDEICCDVLGRVRIRFHWQDPLDTANNRASCWVRVAQRSAGGGMGSQFLPRIGQEVQIQFIEDDINRPLIVGALYNGQGEAGTPATPGGALLDPDTSAYTQASDTSASAQGNLTNGNAPAWHGAGNSADTHNNAAAQWGLRSQEYAGSGYNQLVFDDSDNQGRIQLKTTQSGTELSLGHLIHSADNYRGSFRGNGIELRTDAWGSLRAGNGWLITSYGINHSASQRQTAGDVPASYGLLNTANTLGASLSQLADTHLGVSIAALKGSYKAAASALNESAAPIPALAKVMQGMVDGKQLDSAQSDAAAQNTQVTDQHLPHHTDPIISLIAKNDLSLTARQDMQMHAGETLNLLNADDSQHTTGGVWRIHSGQAIGLTAGGMKRNATAGIQLIAAQGDTTIQAHNDAISLKAKANLDIKSAQTNIDLAAATDITLRTAGGAGITIAGGNITVQCPGKLTVQAGQKSFMGGTSANYALPEMPHGKLYSAAYQVNGEDSKPLAGTQYMMKLPNGEVHYGITDKQGNSRTAYSDSEKPIEFTLLDGESWEQEELNSVHHEMDRYWSKNDA
ncbi:MAG: type VI secretion system Vgr family protein [Sulfuriferula sp.]|nr:type VI secretion system Vgr family protein [Sulfuriferula sp.]